MGRIHGPDWWAVEMGVTGGERRQGGVRRWNDATVRAALVQFVGDRTTWPTYREFRRAGHAGLYEAVRLRGGARRWAIEIGVAAPPLAPVSASRAARSSSTRAAPRWTDQRIASELAAFLAGELEWPRYVDFVTAGRKGLYHAVRNARGPEHWARRMGVRYVRRRGGLPPYWTEQRVRERLALLIDGRDHWPAPVEFEAAGEQRLLAALYRLGGVTRWRTEFGLPATPSPPPASRAPGPPRIWTDTAIAAAVSPLVDALGRWPTKSEFRGAGLTAALAAVYSHGGRPLWQRRLGVKETETRSSGPVPDRTLWTDQTIERGLRRLCRSRSDWPTLREFTDLGALPLYRAASKHGGIARWRERLGLSPANPATR